MKRSTVLAVLLASCLLGIAPRPAAAYWDDVHYHLTYYVAQLVGYTPQQAYRIAAANLSTDYHGATEPTQISITDALLGVPDPQPPEKQNPRWWFHAFRNQTNPLFADAIGNSGRAAEADAAILAQRDRLFRHGISVRNPGVFLHFLQDEGPHQGFGSAWGHWYNPEKPEPSTDLARKASLPIGGSVDWLDFDRQPGQGAGPKSAALDMARETKLWLERFLAEVSPRQKRRETSLLEMEAVIDGLLALGPAPRPLTVAEMKAYSDYRVGKTPAGLTAAQLENFRRHKDGPDLKAAEALVNAALQSMGAVEKAIPPYGPAQKQYQFKVTGDSSVFPVDASGQLTQQSTDDWVLTSQLQVTVETGPGGSREPVEVRIKAPRTLTGQEAYDLIEPLKLSVGSSSTWEHLPIGEVIIEAHRGGWQLAGERVDLKVAQSKVTVRLPVPYDWTGRWEVEHQPTAQGPWYTLGVMTWRKIDYAEAMSVLEKQLRSPTTICQTSVAHATSYTYYLGEFPWGGGGKMIAGSCDVVYGTRLEGRYGHTWAFSRDGFGPGQGSIYVSAQQNPRRFEGDYSIDQSGQPQSKWKGKYLGP